LDEIKEGKIRKDLLFIFYFYFYFLQKKVISNFIIFRLSTVQSTWLPCNHSGDLEESGNYWMGWTIDYEKVHP
jgi:hypothetical protein